MIERLISWSAGNRLLVIMATLIIAAWGVFSMLHTPLDAIPDLSDTQVIIRTQWPGQAPQIVENQLTYPLTTTMLSVPGVKTVRGYSFFGVFLCLRPVQRRYRSVLGALTGIGIPEPDLRTLAEGG